jgi:DNA-binding MarR family transcriptional regulator
MSKSEPLYTSEFGPCACSQLRRAARKLSSLYDRSLESAGVTVTQYALLVNIARAGEISRTSLAAQLGMDRTTLTRNLMPLERANLLSSAKSADRRERLIRLSDKGTSKVRESYVLWKKAQEAFASQMGPVKLQKFRSVLKAAEAAAEIPAKH